MAGIKLTSRDSWIVANWVFHLVIDRVQGALPVSSVAHSLIEDSKEKAGNFVNLETLPDEEKTFFVRAIEEVRKDFGHAGPSSFTSPEFFPSFMKQLDALQECLEKNWPRVGKDGVS